MSLQNGGSFQRTLCGDRFQADKMDTVLNCGGDFPLEHGGCLAGTVVGFQLGCSDLQSAPERPHIILGFWSITPRLHDPVANRQLGHFYCWR